MTGIVLDTRGRPRRFAGWTPEGPWRDLFLNEAPTVFLYYRSRAWRGATDDEAWADDQHEARRWDVTRASSSSRRPRAPSAMGSSGCCSLSIWRTWGWTRAGWGRR